MIRSREPFDFRLLDDELWDPRRRLTEAELFMQGSPGWRRNACPTDDPEDGR